jgi:hypothetical protein
MHEVFKINDPLAINNDRKSKKYPDVPFVIKDKHGDRFLVIYDGYEDKYEFIILDGDKTERGFISGCQYNSLEEMFEKNPDDKILVTELNIIEEYKF